MTTALPIFCLTLLILTIFVRFGEVSREKKRWRRGFVCKTSLLERETGIAEGLLCELGLEYLETLDDESQDVERFLIYKFSLSDEKGERTYIGRQRVKEQVTLKPWFPLRIGRPVRVRYRLDAPSISMIEDADLTA